MRPLRTRTQKARELEGQGDHGGEMLDPGLLGDSVQGSGADRSMGLEQMERKPEPFGVKDSGGPRVNASCDISRA